MFLLKLYYYFNLKRCKFVDLCKPLGDYLILDPNTPAMFIADCYDGCVGVQNITSSFNVYKFVPLEQPTRSESWILYQNYSLIKSYFNFNLIYFIWESFRRIFKTTEFFNIGLNSRELIISPRLFQNDVTNQIWKIEFKLTTISYLHGNSTSITSIFIKLNQLPYGGRCFITPSIGIAASTLFGVNCSNWLDSDGYIVNYSYFGSLGFFQ